MHSTFWFRLVIDNSFVIKADVKKDWNNFERFPIFLFLWFFFCLTWKFFLDNQNVLQILAKYVSSLSCRRKLKKNNYYYVIINCCIEKLLINKKIIKKCCKFLIFLNIKKLISLPFWRSNSWRRRSRSKSWIFMVQNIFKILNF